MRLLKWFIWSCDTNTHYCIHASYRCKYMTHALIDNVFILHKYVHGMSSFCYVGSVQHFYLNDKAFINKCQCALSHH